MDIKGYYKTLGVPEDASQEDIRKAFRELSLKWHPDRWVNGTEEEKKKAEDEFKKIVEAHEVLGNEEKRRKYDSGVGGGQDGPGFDPFAEMFRQAAQQAGWGGFGFNGGFQRPTGHNGDDLEAFVSITLKEAIDGVTKEVTVKRKAKCPDCDGTGSEDRQEHICPNCHGTGTESKTTYVNGMTMTFSNNCRHCHGTGKQIDHPCKKCGGTGLVDKDDKMTLAIPRNMRNGMTVVYGEKGEPGTNGYRNGDLFLHVTVVEDVPGYFKSYDKDLNIYHEESVNFVDAVLGTKVKVKCPDGSDWEIKLRECTQPGERFTKTKGGYVNYDGYIARAGDYVVIIKYDVPGKLTKKQRKALEEFKSEK